jgi:hypothetical protein
MGEVSATITLINAGDVVMVRRGLMKAEEVRQKTVTAIVDTGSTAWKLLALLLLKRKSIASSTVFIPPLSRLQSLRACPFHNRYFLASL